MEDFKNIKTSDYNYFLPEERIAKYPAEKRDLSKLLIWKNGNITNEKFKNITNYIPSGTTLIFNNTRVIHARLFFWKETGAKIEIFCLEPLIPNDYQIAFSETERVTWKCMVGNARKWKEGELSRDIVINGKTVELRAKKTDWKENPAHIEFSWNNGFTFSEIIENAGILPIPPYLNRDTEPADNITYQTVYAKADGSVAAPTAGLHFSEEILSELKKKDISLKEITLHVGAGTFKPVKSETIAGHKMHNEQVSVSKQFIEELIYDKRKIIAVGTTSVRSLESLYWLGVKLKNKNQPVTNIEIGQWKPYTNSINITVRKSLENILDYLNKIKSDTIGFSTGIIILPGYSFKLTDGIITNFHLPQSTLLLLISAFLGDEWKKVYDFALNNDYRFLSYGDSNLYLK